MLAEVEGHGGKPLTEAPNVIVRSRGRVVQQQGQIPCWRRCHTRMHAAARRHIALPDLKNQTQIKYRHLTSDHDHALLILLITTVFADAVGKLNLEVNDFLLHITWC